MMLSMHIDLAHSYWDRLLSPEDSVIDATCGNGRDAAFLAPRCKRLICIDIQEDALAETRNRLEQWSNIDYLKQSHERFPEVAEPIKLIVYNLGYLPGGNKAITTLTETTLKSIEAALDLVCEGGMVSITCYPGHEEGAREELSVLEMIQKLDIHRFEVCHHTWSDRVKTPSLVIVKKKI